MKRIYAKYSERRSNAHLLHFAVCSLNNPLLLDLSLRRQLCPCVFAQDLLLQDARLPVLFGIECCYPALLKFLLLNQHGRTISGPTQLMLRQGNAPLAYLAQFPLRKSRTAICDFLFDLLCFFAKQCSILGFFGKTAALLLPKLHRRDISIPLSCWIRNLYQ
jgi:hypothetical protein